MNLRDFLQDAGLRQRFVNAVLKMKADGVYQIFVDWHLEGAVMVVAHNNLCFLAWHRIFVRLFEMELQKADEALQRAANPSFDVANVISVPWWDYPNLDSADPNDARGRMWRDDFLGGNGSGSDDVVRDGPFGADAGNFPVSDPDWPASLTRSLARTGTRLASRDEIEHTVNRIDTYDDRAFIWRGSGTIGSDSPGSSTNSSFRAVLEGYAITTAVKRKNESIMHNGIHGWVGGMMGNPRVSPNDPVFWLHHCNIDRLWARWQVRFPDDASKHWPAAADITAARTGGVDGVVNANAKQLTEPLIPWDAAARNWPAAGPTLMTTEVYTAGDTLNWTAMGAGLGGYEYSDVNGRAITI